MRSMMRSIMRSWAVLGAIRVNFEVKFRKIPYDAWVFDFRLSLFISLN